MIVARTKGFFTHDQSFEWNSTHQVIILHPVATFRLSLLERKRQKATAGTE